MQWENPRVGVGGGLLQPGPRWTKAQGSLHLGLGGGGRRSFWLTGSLERVQWARLQWLVSSASPFWPPSSLLALSP